MGTPSLAIWCQSVHGATVAGYLTDTYTTPKAKSMTLCGLATWMIGSSSFPWADRVKEGQQASILRCTCDTKLKTSVYQKPTHTKYYILFHSHHHPRTVTGVLRRMQDRANGVCDSTFKTTELLHLQGVFQANGFPVDLVRKDLACIVLLGHRGCWERWWMGC